MTRLSPGRDGASAEGNAIPILAPISELSCVVALDGLVDGEPLALALEATPEQRTALGERLDVIEIRSLAADVRVVRAGPRRLSVDVNYRASVVQCCVVTLEPVPATIEESFTQEFLRVAGGNAEVRVGSGEEAEPVEGDHLDVGEWLTQSLSLAPRSVSAQGRCVVRGFRHRRKGARSGLCGSSVRSIRSGGKTSPDAPA